MNKYGAMAQSRWKNWLPSRYVAIPDPVSFFSQMGAEVSDRIAALELDLLGPDRPDDFLTGVGRRNRAWLWAAELALRGMVLLPPEEGTSSQDDSDELPPEDRLVGAGDGGRERAGDRDGVEPRPRFRAATPGPVRLGVGQGPANMAALYPNAEVRAESFAQARLPEGYARPGDRQRPVRQHRPQRSVAQPTWTQGSTNHFLVKALHRARSAGLVAAFTSRYTMDLNNPGARREIPGLGRPGLRVAGPRADPSAGRNPGPHRPSLRSAAIEARLTNAAI